MNKKLMRKIICILVIVLLEFCLDIYSATLVIAKQNNANSYIMTPTVDGSNQVTHPDVVYFKKGLGGYKYWMVCTPYPNSNQNYENPYILVSNGCKFY